METPLLATLASCYRSSSGAYSHWENTYNFMQSNIDMKPCVDTLWYQQRRQQLRGNIDVKWISNAIIDFVGQKKVDKKIELMLGDEAIDVITNSLPGLKSMPRNPHMDPHMDPHPFPFHSIWPSANPHPFHITRSICENCGNCGNTSRCLENPWFCLVNSPERKYLLLPTTRTWL